MSMAELVNGKTSWGADAPMLEITPDGVTGHRDFLVHTLDPYKAMFTPGVPRAQPEPDAWDNDFPTLYVTRVQVKRIGGVVQPSAEDGGGWSWVSVDYATPGAQGTLPPPVEDQPYSVMKLDIDTATAQFDLRSSGATLPTGVAILPPTGPGSLAVSDPIANGRGARRNIGRMSLEVIVYRRPERIPLLQMTRMAYYQAVNPTPMNLPPIVNSGLVLSLQPGQIQYRGFELPDVRVTNSSLVKVKHVLAIAEDFYTRWTAEDSVGRAVGTQFVSVIYPAMAYTGLW